MSYPNNPPVPASITVDTTASINSGLVGFWPLTDGTGTTAVDLSTGGSDGTLVSTAGWKDTSIGKSLRLDSTGEYVNSGIHTEVEGLSAVSISAWVYFEGTAATRACVVGNDEAQLWFGILDGGADDGTLSCRINNTIGDSSAGAVAYDTWQHIVMAWDGSTIEGYVNGQDLGIAQARGGTLNNSSYDVWFGTTNRLARQFIGDMQNVRVYNRALTPTEVAELYSVPWTGTDYVAQNLTPDTPIAMGVDPNHSLSSGLVGYWPLSDGSGTVARNLIEEYDGTLNGTASFVDTEKGTAITLDGNSDYVTFGSIGETVGKFTSSSAVTASIDFKLNGIPAASASYILCTVYLSAGQAVHVLGIGESSGAATIFGVVRSQIGDAYTPTEYVGLETGRWYNATVVGDLVAGTVKLYLNGKEVDSVTPTFGSTTFVDNNDQINYDAIGVRSGAPDRFFDGEVSNYRLYNRALSATEVEDLYNEPWAGVVTAKSAPPQYLTVDTADSINTGLQGFWPLSDGSGTTAVDLSANGNDGTASGSATFGSTSLGVAADYDGSASFHWLADSFSYTTELTVSCWLRSDGTGVEQPAFCKGRSNNCVWWLGINASDQIRFATKRAGLYRYDHSVTNISDWHHLVLVQNTAVSPGIEAYVDGVSVSSDAGLGAFSSTLSIPMLGAATLSSSTPPTSVEDFEGNVSNARIWNRALSASEVSRLYQDPWAGTNRAIEPSPTVKDLDTSSSLTTNLVGWWPLTEFGPQDTLAYDISGNDYHCYTSSGIQRQVSGLTRSVEFPESGADYDLASDTVALDLSGGYTMSAWIRHEEAGGALDMYGAGIVIGDDTGSSDIEWYYTSTTTAPQWPQLVHNRSNGGTLYAGTNYTHPDGNTNKSNSNGRWEHHVIRYDPSDGSTYTFVNGFKRPNDPVGGPPLATSGKQIRINNLPVAAGTKKSLQCAMQNVRIYDRVLTDAEVQTLYDDPWVGLATDSLVYAYYSAAFLQRLG